MIETRIYLLRLIASGSDQCHQFVRWRYTTRIIKRVWATHWILGCKQVAVGTRGRSAGNDELMRREAWSLVSLEHAVAESVGFCHLEIRRYIGGWRILEPGVGWRAGWRRAVNAIYAI